MPRTFKPALKWHPYAVANRTKRQIEVMMKSPDMPSKLKPTILHHMTEIEEACRKYEAQRRA